MCGIWLRDSLTPRERVEKRLGVAEQRYESDWERDTAIRNDLQLVHLLPVTGLIPTSSVSGHGEGKLYYIPTEQAV